MLSTPTARTRKGMTCRGERLAIRLAEGNLAEGNLAVDVENCFLAWKIGSLIFSFFG